MAGPARKSKKPSARSANRGPKGSRGVGLGVASAMGSMTQSRQRIVSAPNSIGLTTFGNARESLITVPFSAVSNSTVDTLAGGSTLVFRTAATAGGGAFDLNPISNTVGTLQSNPFGVGIANIARAYSRWRMKSLRITYVPVVGTASAGSVCLGVTLENYISNTPTFQQASDCSSSITTPVWQMASMDATPLMRAAPDWLYVYVQGSTVSEQRQDFCCSLICAGIGLVAAGGANTTNGYLRFDGEIQFMSLSDVVGGFLDPTDHECKTQDQPPLGLSPGLAKANWSEPSKEDIASTEQAPEELVHSREESGTHCATPSPAPGIPSDKRSGWFLPSVPPLTPLQYAASYKVAAKQ